MIVFMLHNWEIVPLRELVLALKGKKPKKLSNTMTEGTVPYIDIKAFEKGEIRQYADVQSSKLSDKEDVLIVWDGARSGLVGIGYTGAIGSTIMALKPILINPRYLFRFLQTRYGQINSQPRGSGIPHVNPEVFWNLNFPLTPLSEQHRIVNKLEKLLARVNNCRDRLDTIPGLLKRFRQSVLAAACSGRLTADWREKNPDVEPIDRVLEDIQKRRLTQASATAQKQKIRDTYSYQEEGDSDLLPKYWEYIALDKLCESFQYGTSKKSMSSGKVPVLRMGNLQNGEISWIDLVYTSDDEEIEKYKLKPGDVLFNRTNSPELVGKTSIYRGKYPAIFAGYLIKINNYKEVLSSEYLSYCLNSIYAKEFFLRVKTDGVHQSNINAQKLGKFEVPFCSIKEQQEIVRRVDALFKIAGQIEARYQKARAYVDKLTQSILAKAFRGELAPQAPADEPASILLERIRKERARRELESLQKGNSSRRKSPARQRKEG